MTIQDLTEQMTIQGKVVIKEVVGDDAIVRWECDEYNQDLSCEVNKKLKRYIDREIIYMYAIDRVGLVIEIESEDE